MKNKITIFAAIAVVIASIVAYYLLEDQLQAVRVAVVLAGVVIGALIALTSETGKSAWAFAKGANVERQKVVWPTRREAMMVTIMVMVLVIIIGLFIALVDKILFETIYNLILGVKSQ